MACFMACHAQTQPLPLLRRAILNPATEPNSYRSLRYHFIVRLTLTSSHPRIVATTSLASGRRQTT